MKHVFYFLPIAMLLTSCATMKEGPKQTVRIDTPKHRGAACDLKNRRGSWHVGSTPATVEIARAASPLEVVCHRGTHLGKASVQSTFQKQSIIGGISGMSVDVATGSAYVYPATIKVSLQPVR